MLLAKILNAHPEISVAMDNSVYESWSLYYYRTRQGLVQELRVGMLTPDQARARMLEYLVKDGQVWGVAPSPKVAGYPLAPAPVRPGSDEPVRWGFTWRISRSVRRRLGWRGTDPHRFVRHRVPVASYRDDLRLCLKSPEIVFVLPELVRAFPQSKIVLVYRPIIEIAESMYRKGFEWRLSSYHRRWKQEVDEYGDLIPPPGVPEKWRELWSGVSDFQRCVIYAASYLRAMALDVPKLPEPVFIYDHVDLRQEPSSVLDPLAEYLGVEAGGWQRATKMIQKTRPKVSLELEIEYAEIAPEIAVQEWSTRIARLATKGY